MLRLAEAGHEDAIRRELRETAMAEIAVYRDVTTAVMTHLGRILGWPQSKLALLAAGAQAVYAYDRLAGWRRMVSRACRPAATHWAARRPRTPPAS